MVGRLDRQSLVAAMAMLGLIAVAAASGTARAHAEMMAPPASPGIILELTATVDRCPGGDPITVLRGTDVTYCYTVSNGDRVTTLTDIRVTDDQFGADAVGRIARLEPGETRTLTATRPALTHDQTSFATAAGTPALGAQVFPPVSAGDSVRVDVR